MLMLTEIPFNVAHDLYSGVDAEVDKSERIILPRITASVAGFIDDIRRYDSSGLELSDLSSIVSA
jgi:hypothetical protein